MAYLVKWNPYTTLSIDCYPTTCYGWVPSQGCKCSNPIDLTNRQEAESVILKMCILDPSNRNLDAWLQELAHRILCKPDHQDQAEGVVRRWKMDIQGYLDRQEVELQEANVETRPVDRRLRRAQEWRRRARERWRVASSGNVTTRLEHPGPTTPISGPSSSTAPATVPAPASSHPATAERTLSGDCSICYESLLDGNTLVCCKAQCRQYFHGGCMGTWLQEARAKRCPCW